MKRNKRYSKKLRFTHAKVSLMTLFCCSLFLRGYTELEKTGENYFHIFINGTQIGTIAEKEKAEALLIAARKEIASENEELTFIDVDMKIVGEEVLWGLLDDEEVVFEKMKTCLRDNIKETMHHSYTMKVNEYMINLSSIEEVQILLETAIRKYDSEGKFGIDLAQDLEREFNVLSADVVSLEEKNAKQKQSKETNLEAGVQTVLSQVGTNLEDVVEKKFEDYELGLLSMDFSEEVEIVEVYLPESQITSLDTAIQEVTKDQETPGEYEVVAGDTLSEIAIKVDIPMDKIIEMNDTLENENSMIHIGDKLIITVPEPELSVERVEENYYEEIYDADTIYIENKEWYTTETVIRQQPSAGLRKIIAKVSYLNDKEISKEIVKEEVVLEAVPKIVESGTKIPPTYIKPISGGRQTSGFGRRKAPTKGASSYHKGLDWAVPTGTAVYASCGGTVSRAGWGSGYGYVVYIDHDGGRQTRYGHLSKVLVKVGQTVKQGDKIALSGNTGISTGAHLHFEILINGTQVNPLDYLE